LNPYGLLQWCDDANILLLNPEGGEVHIHPMYHFVGTHVYSLW